MKRRIPRSQHAVLALSLVLFALAGPLRFWLASGEAQLLNRSVTLSDSRPGTTSSYRFAFDLADTPVLGSIRFQFCANSPVIGQPCDAPAGFDGTPALLSDKAGNVGFTVASATAANDIIISRDPVAASNGTSSYVFQGIQNPTSAGSYYIRVQMYSEQDAAGLEVEQGGLAYAISDGVGVNATVPPYLLFCTGITIQPYECSTATGDYIDFGELSSDHTSTGQTQLLAATNSDTGYDITAIGQTLTSGNNVIQELDSPDVSRPGVSQFGLNLRADTTPPIGHEVEGSGAGTVANGYNVPDFYKFSSGTVIASSTSPDDYRLYTASYIVNISHDQPAGVYVTTITYLCLANF